MLFLNKYLSSNILQLIGIQNYHCIKYTIYVLSDQSLHFLKVFYKKVSLIFAQKMKIPKKKVKKNYAFIDIYMYCTYKDRFVLYL